MSDELDLVRQLGRGDEEAFRALVERESGYLYGIAHAMSGNATDAEDLVQETFTGALKSRFRGESSVRTWLVRILVRRAGMLHRWRSRRGSQRSVEIETASGREIGPSTPPETGITDAVLDLSAMLQDLSPDHRSVIILRELRGMTYDEMAAALGVPRGTVESRLHRAREELRRRYKGYL